MWALASLLILVTAMAVLLVLYLRAFEAQETQRRRSADALWLEQGVQFHFRRLELDLQARARQDLAPKRPLGVDQTAPTPYPSTARDEDADASSVTVTGGQLWSDNKVVLAHGWLDKDATALNASARGDRLAHPTNAKALETQNRIVRGLQRASYAGPMLDRQGQTSDVVWLSVPVFERGAWVGNYAARLSMQAAIDAMVPAWFRAQHQLSLVDGQQTKRKDALPDGDAHYVAYMELPGTDLGLRVQPLDTTPFWTVPRMLLGAALLFLLGTVISLVVLRRDMQKRLRVEGSLQAQVALRTAMENAVTLGLRAWDLDGRILYVNQAFCRMVGYAEAELIGRQAPLPYWPSDQLDELGLLHQGVIAQGTSQSGMELKFQHREGHLVDVLIHEAPLTDARGRQFGWMSSVLDISERKRAERMAARQQEKLEASGRLVAMGEVASTLAHELNQPLGALSGFATGLLNRIQSGRVDWDTVPPIVERMQRLAEKAGRIIQRVNSFARRREMDKQPLALSGFVSRLLHQLHLPKSVHLSASMPKEEVWVEADGQLLEHAVVNVLNNAVHWAQQGSAPARIQVRLHEEADTVTLTISDSGPGIGADHTEHIFSAFYSDSEGGMGMGLAICRSVVEAHGGHIEVGRDAALGGAQFTLSLPKRPARSEQAAQERVT